MTETTTTPGQEPNQTGQEPNGAGQPDIDAPSGSNDSGQEPQSFDPEYVKSLRSENARRRKREQELQAQVEEFQNAKLTESQRLEKERDGLKSEAESLRMENLYLKVAHKTGLPLDMVEGLPGSTEDELTERAKARENALRRHFGIDGQEPDNQPDFDAGVRRPIGGRPESMNSMILRAYENR